MELTKDHYNLIETVVKNNKRFSGNEDLFKDVCEETIKRSFSILSTLNDDSSLEFYLNKIVNTVIFDLIKQHGRSKRPKSKFQTNYSIKNRAVISYLLDENEEIVFDIPDFFADFELPNFSDEELNEIQGLISKVDSADPEKKYYDIFVMRYINKMNQSEIASHLSITESDVSIRISELVQIIASYI